jgi:hypothetical protein
MHIFLKPILAIVTLFVPTVLMKEVIQEHDVHTCCEDTLHSSYELKIMFHMLVPSIALIERCTRINGNNNGHWQSTGILITPYGI